MEDPERGNRGDSGLSSPADVAPNDLQYRIAKLALGRDDVLVVKLDWEPTPEQAARVARHISEGVGRPRRVLVVPPGIDLEVLTAAEIEDRIL